METLLTYRGAVYPWHCDQNGHMNNMWFAGKFDEASWNLVLQLGITPTYLRESHCGMAAVEQNTTFTCELMAGDVVEVRTGVVEVREKVIRFVHTMINAETQEPAATCAIVGVHIDRRVRKSCPFPDAIRENAERFAGLRLAA